MFRHHGEKRFLVVVPISHYKIVLFTNAVSMLLNDIPDIKRVLVQLSMSCNWHRYGSSIPSCGISLSYFRLLSFSIALFFISFQFGSVVRSFTEYCGQPKYLRAYICILAEFFFLSFFAKGVGVTFWRKAVLEC